MRFHCTLKCKCYLVNISEVVSKSLLLPGHVSSSPCALGETVVANPPNIQTYVRTCTHTYVCNSHTYVCVHIHFLPTYVHTYFMDNPLSEILTHLCTYTYVPTYVRTFCIPLFGLALVHFLYHKANDVMNEGQSMECITGWLEEYVSEVVTDCYHEEVFAETTKRQKQV